MVLGGTLVMILFASKCLMAGNTEPVNPLRSNVSAILLRG